MMVVIVIARSTNDGSPLESVTTTPSMFGRVLVAHVAQAANDGGSHGAKTTICSVWVLVALS